jgi:hypothetical protein
MHLLLHLHHSRLVSSRKWVYLRCASPLLSRTHQVAGHSCSILHRLIPHLTHEWVYLRCASPLLSARCSTCPPALRLLGHGCVVVGCRCVACGTVASLAHGKTPLYLPSRTSRANFALSQVCWADLDACEYGTRVVKDLVRAHPFY